MASQTLSLHGSRLPVRVEPEPGELLFGYLGRVAAANHAPPDTITNGLGLDGRYPYPVGVECDDELSGRLQLVLSLTAEQVAALHPDPRRLEPIPGHLRELPKWARYCPSCLHEQPIWLRRWCDPLVAVCTRHDLALCDTDPATGRPIRPRHVTALLHHRDWAAARRTMKPVRRLSFFQHHLDDERQTVQPQLDGMTVEVGMLRIINALRNFAPTDRFGNLRETVGPDEYDNMIDAGYEYRTPFARPSPFGKADNLWTSADDLALIIEWAPNQLRDTSILRPTMEHLDAFHEDARLMGGGQEPSYATASTKPYEGMPFT